VPILAWRLRQLNRRAKIKIATTFNKTNVSDWTYLKLARIKGLCLKTAMSQRAPNKKNEAMRQSSNEDSAAIPAPNAPPIKNSQENNLELMMMSCGAAKISAVIKAHRFENQTPQASIA